MDFYADIADRYDSFFPLSRQKVEFFSRLLAENDAVEVLDLACGSGSLSLALAKEGFSLVGIDDTDVFFQSVAGGNGAAWNAAGASAESTFSFSDDERRRVPVEFVVAKMEELPFVKAALFDAVICIGNSISHLPGEGAVESLIRECAGILRERGLLVIQAMDFSKLRRMGVVKLPDLEGGCNDEGDTVILRRSYVRDRNGCAFTPEVISGARTMHYRISMYPLEYDQLWRILSKHGFLHYGTFADFSGGKLDDSSMSYITIATRKARD